MHGLLHDPDRLGTWERLCYSRDLGFHQMVLDMKEMEAWRMLAVAGAVPLLEVAVLVIRFGHVRFPYGHEPEGHL